MQLTAEMNNTDLPAWQSLCWPQWNGHGLKIFARILHALAYTRTPLSKILDLPLPVAKLLQRHLSQPEKPVTKLPYLDPQTYNIHTNSINLISRTPLSYWGRIMHTWSRAIKIVTKNKQSHTSPLSSSLCHLCLSYSQQMNIRTI